MYPYSLLDKFQTMKTKVRYSRDTKCNSKFSPASASSIKIDNCPVGYCFTD